MDRIVFFADVLGFSGLARRPGATGAVDALSDLATVLSSNNEIARLVRSDVWIERYGLSDSIFLVAEDPRAACAAAVELFFNLAYIHTDSASPVLLRGAVTSGEVRRTEPLFPESATANLVGEAVVEAVALEGSGAKGPRLLISEAVAGALEAGRRVAEDHWPLHRTEEGVAELLWLLPAGPARQRVQVNGTMIGELCGAVIGLLLEHGLDPRIGAHYRAYFSLAWRSLLRLEAEAPDEFRLAVQAAALGARKPAISSVIRESDLEIPASEWETVLGQA